MMQKTAALIKLEIEPTPRDLTW